ncbi:MAG: hypothetical protein DHS20C18_14630 [Saprospiraceae bacterium]|nr:MAG: hypothetical protein DHS20C18_14630 [Saprospiraceae bacterium]
MALAIAMLQLSFVSMSAQQTFNFQITYIASCDLTIGQESPFNSDEYCYSWVSDLNNSVVIQTERDLEVSIFEDATLIQVVMDDDGNVLAYKEYNLKYVEISVSPETGAIHEGETSIDLSVEGLDDFTGYSFDWSHVPGIDQQTVSVSSPGIYSVVVTTPGGCVFELSANVFRFFSDHYEICMDECLDIGIPINNSLEYIWSDGETNSSTRNLCFNKNESYNLRIFENDILIEMRSYRITIKGSNFSIGPDPMFYCAGMTNSLFWDAENLDAEDISSILWSTGQSTEIITIAGPGVYSVTVTTESGCTLTDKIIVATPNDCSQAAQWFTNNDFYVTPIYGYEELPGIQNEEPKNKNLNTLTIIEDFTNLNIITVNNHTINIGDYMLESLENYPYSSKVFITSNLDGHCSESNGGGQTDFQAALDGWLNDNDEAFYAWFHICVDSNDEGTLYFNYRSSSFSNGLPPSGCPPSGENDCYVGHPVRLAILQYDEDILEALYNANNISVKTFHQQARNNDKSDQGKVVGIIGETKIKKRILEITEANGPQYFEKPTIHLGYCISNLPVDVIAYYHFWKVEFLGFTVASTSAEISHQDPADLSALNTEIVYLDPETEAFLPMRLVSEIFEVKTYKPDAQPRYVLSGIETGVRQVKERFNKYPEFTGGGEITSQARIGVLIYSDAKGYQDALSLYGSQLSNVALKLWDLEAPNVYGELQQAGFFGTANYYYDALCDYEDLFDILREIETPCP